MTVEQRDTIWRNALAIHWLAGIKCDHSQKTDVSSCACGWYDRMPRMTVGTAVKTWIGHVMDQVRVALPVDESLVTEQQQYYDTEIARRKTRRVEPPWCEVCGELPAEVGRRHRCTVCRKLVCHGCTTTTAKDHGGPICRNCDK
jgi:hypothetical protein